MKVKCVAHLAYYMFAAIGVAAEVKGDAMVLRLNALEEVVTQMILDNDAKEEAITNLKEDNDALRSELISMRSRRTTSNDIKEEAISNLESEVKNLGKDINVLRNELISIRSRRTTSTTNLDDYLKVVGRGESKKLVVTCKTEFRKPVKITDDVLVTEGNLMIVNGGKSFDHFNGKGNLVIGASEVTQMGTHNIVIGDTHTFSSYGGLVVGYNNTISGPFSAVIGGRDNTASGHFSAVSGIENNATSYGSVVSGGSHNVASGLASIVIGGENNTATEDFSVVGGGQGSWWNLRRRQYKNKH